MPEPSQMRREIDEIPEVVERLLSQGAPAIARAKEAIGPLPPYLLSVARGSSDHACTYLKYASELLLGRPMASVGPSVASVYGADLHVPGALCLAVSQSGQSPDIVALTRRLTEAGATSVAITNDPEAPLAQEASAALPILAGPERSVAATKTFVTSVVAGLWLLAELKEDTALLNAIRALPAQLEAAGQVDWSPVSASLAQESLFVLGRGPSWAMANEAALKFKETCQIHAESYSSAEVLHGPVSIVGGGFPVLAFASGDAAENAVIDVSDQLTNLGASVFITSSRAKSATPIPHVRTDHWLTDPISLIVSFYRMVESVAVSRAIDVDRPRHLKKVTETV